MDNDVESIHKTLNELSRKLAETCDGYSIATAAGALLALTCQMCMHSSRNIEEALDAFDRLTKASRNDLALNWDTFKSHQRNLKLQ